MLIERDISSFLVVIDRDEASDVRIMRTINESLEKIKVKVGQWEDFVIEDSFGQLKKISTYLLIVPPHEQGALERVILDALNDIPQESNLIQKVVQFIDSLKAEVVPKLNQTNLANKAAVGTFFSVREPKLAMRAFGVFISQIDWSKSESLKKLFLPFDYLGKEKPTESS